MNCANLLTAFVSSASSLAGEYRALNIPTISAEHTLQICCSLASLSLGKGAFECLAVLAFLASFVE